MGATFNRETEMAKLPDTTPDPTLEAIDRAIEARQSRRHRNYLGMSAIGRPCDRELWYSFRHCLRPEFDAASLKRFEDGHRGEDLQAKRLRMVKGIELHVKGADGEQFGFEDLGGHFRGHMDGAIRGLLQAPKTWHVWEHKQVSDKGLAKLLKAIQDHGEKAALREWDETYHAQAQLYMWYSGMSRHYLTCSSPGGRHTIGVRTNADKGIAKQYQARASRIIFSQHPPSKLSDDPSWWQCRFCSYQGICHEKAIPEPSCRNCLHTTPEEDGTWSCVVKGPVKMCSLHLFIPDLIGVPVDANEGSVEYECGRVNLAGGAVEEVKPAPKPAPVSAPVEKPWRKAKC
jgi:hypothetical protein